MFLKSLVKKNGLLVSVLTHENNILNIYKFEFLKIGKKTIISFYFSAVPNSMNLKSAQNRAQNKLDVFPRIRSS